MLSPIEKAVNVIKKSKALLITAGAGMGCDSGLPDFRGPEGFWRAYPPFKVKGLTFPEVSTPSLFEDDPHAAWGFFGHRHKLYTSTQPHLGFQILKKWCSSKSLGHFVFTSNVDGHFQKAGFSEENVVECHGSIHFMQCTRGYNDIWPTPKDFHIEFDTNFRAADPLPMGPPNESFVMARPNILMFGDFYFQSDRVDAQNKRFNNWLNGIDRSSELAIIEIGAGTAVPTVRYTGEHIALKKVGNLIRINPREPEVDEEYGIEIELTGLDALQKIDAFM